MAADIFEDSIDSPGIRWVSRGDGHQPDLAPDIDKAMSTANGLSHITSIRRSVRWEPVVLDSRGTRTVRRPPRRHRLPSTPSSFRYVASTARLATLLDDVSRLDFDDGKEGVPKGWHGFAQKHGRGSFSEAIVIEGKPEPVDTLRAPQYEQHECCVERNPIVVVR